MTDFERIKEMLSKAHEKFYIDEIGGEHPLIVVESSSENYDTSVCFGFNDDSSLWGVWGAAPEPEEEDDED